MNAEAFNKIYEGIVDHQLIEEGFVKRGKSLYLENRDATLALLRFQSKFSGLLQRTNLILCIRHRFLRELVTERPVLVSPSSIDDYPFKLRPSKLAISSIQHWKYHPINLGVREGDYDEIQYGDVENIEKIRPLLQLIASNTLEGGRALLEKLSPENAMRELILNGENAWCENYWIRDYESYIQGSALQNV